MGDDSGFLRLLLDEASADAFERPVALAQARGASDEEIAALREDSVVALRIRATLRERRRREVELAALYETGRDLISIRDVERVLKAIARRARQLLDADTAYLTLIDEERGDTYMRVTEGMLTEEFKHVRLPLGVGLGGLVAQTSTPYFTSNYLEDPRFVHTGEIDGVVGGEELTAILGVPLLVGDTVIGVLFTSNRQPRPFAAHEVNLLASLAAHAAIAIENARLFQEAEDALAELHDAHELLRARSAAVERAADVHERLTHVVLQGGSLDDVADAVVGVLGGDLRVLDPDGRLLAVVGTVDDLVGDRRPMHDPLCEALALAGESGRSVAVPGGWVTPIISGAENLGALVLTGVGDLGDADLRTLERAGHVTALVLLKQRSVAETAQRQRSELLTDLLTRPKRDLDALRRGGRVAGLDLDRPHTVAVASVEDERQRLLSVATRIAQAHHGVAGEVHGTVVLLVPGDDGGRIQDSLRSGLPREHVTATVGVAGPVSAPDALAEAYGQADRCRRALLALGRHGQIAAAEELGVYGQLFSASGRAELARFVSATLGTVLEYDAEKGTDLIATLQAYFDAQGNVTRAARELHVHPNTLYQRLGRLGELLGDGWQEAEPSLRVHLALQVRRLADALG